MAPLKRLPYGVSDFKQLRNEDKYLKADATEAEAARQWEDALEQIRKYAQGARVKNSYATLSCTSL